MGVMTIETWARFFWDTLYISAQQWFKTLEQLFLCNKLLFTSFGHETLCQKDFEKFLKNQNWISSFALFFLLPEPLERMVATKKSELKITQA